MDITEVRIKLVPPGHDKLRAFCSITIDNNFVIRDLKVIEGSKGAFVAMPSRKLTNRCPRCGGKNHHRATYCNDCGRRLPDERLPLGAGGRAKLHADIAHPINSECRTMIQQRVLDVYQEEESHARDPDYRSADFDAFEADYLESEYPREVSPPEPRAGGEEPRRARAEDGVTGTSEIAARAPESERQEDAFGIGEPPARHDPIGAARDEAKTPPEPPAPPRDDDLGRRPIRPIRPIREVRPSPGRYGGRPAATEEERAEPAAGRDTWDRGLSGSDLGQGSRPPSSGEGVRKAVEDPDGPEDNFGAGLFS